MARLDITILLFVAWILAICSHIVSAETAPRAVHIAFPPLTSKFVCTVDPATGLKPEFVCSPQTNPDAIAFGQDDMTVSARYQYKNPVQLWKQNSKYVASISTSYTVMFDRFAEFTFSPLFGGGGLAFAITPSLSCARTNDGSLGLFEIDSKTGKPLAGAEARTVAVEIDDKRDAQSWDPIVPHIALDVNSVRSVKSKYLGNPNNFIDMKIGVWVDYDALKKTIQVRTHKVKADQTPDRKKASLAISHTIDLATQVKEFSYVGFSARVPKGDRGTYRIYQWKFSTTWVLGTTMH